jgi:hypothetical protein
MIEMPFFYNQSDDDGNENVAGPYQSREDAMNSADDSDLDISRPVYRALNKRTAEKTLRGSGGRMSADEPLPPLRGEF